MSEHDRIMLNTLFWLWQGSEYVLSNFRMVLNMTLVLDMPGLRIWQDCEYVMVTQGAE